MSDPKLAFNDVTKVFDTPTGSETAVNSVSMEVEEQEFVTVVGPSGCGKSTTLRLIAGLETVTGGAISVAGEQVQDYGPSSRPVAMVFQSFALYNHMTARENIEYGLKHSTDFSKTERREKVEEMASLLEISDHLDNKPPNMSGGQKQRVALGRALVRDPEIFLLDEPLANLDAKLRTTMRAEIRRIHDELDMTTIYVTHNQQEAMTMADRIVVMDDGEFQQVDTPQKIYDLPANRFVSEFIGSPPTNVFDVAVTSDPERASIRFAKQEIRSVSYEVVPELTDVNRAYAGIRPENLAIHQHTSEVSGAAFQAEIDTVEYQGTELRVNLNLDQVSLVATLPPDAQFQEGESVKVSFSPEDVLVFLPDGTRVVPKAESAVDPRRTSTLK